MEFLQKYWSMIGAAVILISGYSVMQYQVKDIKTKIDKQGTVEYIKKEDFNELKSEIEKTREYYETELEERDDEFNDKFKTMESRWQTTNIELLGYKVNELRADLDAHLKEGHE